MSKAMKISAIIPTFNAGNYIIPLLESISHQTRLPDEVVVSDDASTDSTIELIEEFASQANIPIKILHHEPEGISANYTNALFNSSGDIVIVGDHDDIWLPNKVEYIHRAFSENPEVAVVATDSEIVDEQLRSLGTTLRGGLSASSKQAKIASKNDFRFFLMGARLDAHTLSFRAQVKEILQETDFSGLPGFWFENRVCAAALSFGKLLYLPDVTTLYRQHPSQHIGHAQPGIESYIKRDGETAFIRANVLKSLLENNQAKILISTSERELRQKKLDDYIAFLKIRYSNKYKIKKIIRLAMALEKGVYNEFCTYPVRSFAKDMLITMKPVSSSHTDE